jgi:hypothetical protein
MSAAEIAQLRQQVGGKAAAEIALAAGLGMAERNPAAAKAELAKGDKSVFGKYLDAGGVERITEAITEQERAAEIEKNRAEDAERKRKAEAAETSANDYTSRILIDPTKVSPKDIANDPTLDSVQKRVISNFLDEELRKSKGGGDPEENKGPGFWSAYNKVFANGFKSVDEIYGMAGPGKPLTLQGANALASLWRGRREGLKVGDYQTERTKSFFDTMHDNFVGDLGGGVEAENAWNRFYYDKTRQIENRGDKQVDQLIDEKSPDYIGGNWRSYLPPENPADDVVPLEPAKQGIWDYLGSFFSGAKFDLKELDSKIKDGAEGASQGVAAVKSAIASGAMTREQAGEYLVKRGWARPNAAKQSVPPALK